MSVVCGGDGGLCCRDLRGARPDARYSSLSYALAESDPGRREFLEGFPESFGLLDGVQKQVLRAEQRPLTCHTPHPCAVAIFSISLRTRPGRLIGMSCELP